MYIIPAVPYLFIRLTGCLLNPGISCGAHKLSGHLELKKKRKKFQNLLIKNQIHDLLLWHQKPPKKEHIAGDFGENSSLDFTQEKENEEHARGIDQ
jgi:hypothetical protein